MIDPSHGKRRGLVVIGALALAAAAGTVLLLLRPSAGPPERAAAPLPPVPVPAPAWSEPFDGPGLDPARWTLSAEGDFREKTVDLQGGRLRLRCGTIGTDDKTVKFLGVRSAARVRLGAETRIAAEFDWNRQANGSYLASALILAPEPVDTNPLRTKDWLKVEYVGVPPGRNGRIVVAQRNAGRDLMPFTEGWPQVRREGRPISVQKVEVVVRSGMYEVHENGQKVYESKERLGFQEAHLYLQMSSHSNYPPREVFWDNVTVSTSN